MANPDVSERVLETSTTTGTGNLALAGPADGYRSFDAAFGTGRPFWYVIESVDDDGRPTGSWEAGEGVLTSSATLVRTTVVASSNGNNPVSFPAGTKRVFCDAPRAGVCRPYVHAQDAASLTWSITHNLGRFPSVTVVDSAGTQVVGRVVYDSVNALTLTFSAAFSGKAYLN